jgi:adiponectin receptor
MVPQNECILYGYLPESAGLYERFFTWHNETLNIWTHLLGLLYFARVTLGLKSMSLQLYTASVSILFFCSTMFHTFMTRSWRTLDFYAIALTLWAGHFPHAMSWKNFTYLVPATLSLACVIYMTNKPEFHEEAWQTYRVLVYSAQGVIGVMAIVHASLQLPRRIIYLELCNMLMQFCGSVIYAFRFPECYFLGDFNYIGQSHTIFHLFIIAGFYCHLRAFI